MILFEAVVAAVLFQLHISPSLSRYVFNIIRMIPPSFALRREPLAHYNGDPTAALAISLVPAL